MAPIDLVPSVFIGFVASIDTNFKIENTIVPFNKVELNSGLALSKDGTFTAPSGTFSSDLNQPALKFDRK